MRLHEYYFEKPGGKGVLDKSGKLAPIVCKHQKSSLIRVEAFMAS